METGFFSMYFWNFSITAVADSNEIRITIYTLFMMSWSCANALCYMWVYGSAIDFCWGFWYGALPSPFTFEGAKLLTASKSAVEWYKSCAHTYVSRSYLKSFKFWYVCTYQLNVNEVRIIATIFWQKTIITQTLTDKNLIIQTL